MTELENNDGYIIYYDNEPLGQVEGEVFIEPYEDEDSTIQGTPSWFGENPDCA